MRCDVSAFQTVPIVEGVLLTVVIFVGVADQKIENVTSTPVVYRAFNPPVRAGHFHNYEGDTSEHRNHPLNEQCVKRPITSDSAKGRPKPPEDPLADVADIPSQDLRAAGDAHRRNLLTGPDNDAATTAVGYGLYVT